MPSLSKTAGMDGVRGFSVQGSGFFGSEFGVQGWRTPEPQQYKTCRHVCPPSDGNAGGSGSPCGLRQATCILRRPAVGFPPSRSVVFMAQRVVAMQHRLGLSVVWTSSCWAALAVAGNGGCCFWRNQNPVNETVVAGRQCVKEG